MKKLLSLIFSFCLVLSCSVSVLAVGDGIATPNGLRTDVYRYVNSNYANLQRVIITLDNFVANVEVLYLDGEVISPAVIVDNDAPVSMIKGDYSYTLSVKHPKKDSIVNFYSITIIDLAADNAIIDQVNIGYSPSNEFIFSMGANHLDNYKFYQNKEIRDIDILPVSDLIRSKSDEICKGITKDLDKAHAIYNWVANNIAYDFDALNNSTYSLVEPDNIVSEGYAVCEGLSLLYRALCNAQGIPCRVYYGLTENGVGHAWNEFYTKGGNGVGAGWYFVDCTPVTINGKENNVFKARTDNFRELEYKREIYFMPDIKAVDDYVKYIDFYENSVQGKDYSTSEWAVNEFRDAVHNSLLVEEFFLDDYRTPATREYFCGIVARYIWCEISKAKSDVDANQFLGLWASMAPDMEGLDSWTSQFCAGAELVYGKGDVGFCPTDYITRAEAATIIQRVSKLMYLNGYTFSKYDLKEFSEISSNSYFADHNDIPEWSLDGCYGCKDKSIIKGDDLGRFLPNDKLSCEQAIAIFNRLYAKN